MRNRHKFAQSEVGYLDLLVFGDQNVIAFEIPMNYPFLVEIV